MVKYKGLWFMKSWISGIVLGSSFPKTNSYLVLEVLLHIHMLINGGVTNKVVYLNLPYMANRNLRKNGKIGSLSLTITSLYSIPSFHILLAMFCCKSRGKVQNNSLNLFRIFTSVGVMYNMFPCIHYLRTYIVQRINVLPNITHV